MDVPAGWWQRRVVLMLGAVTAVSSSDGRRSSGNRPIHRPRLDPETRGEAPPAIIRNVPTAAANVLHSDGTWRREVRCTYAILSARRKGTFGEKCQRTVEIGAG
jgi:hypothetical protein